MKLEMVSSSSDRRLEGSQSGSEVRLLSAEEGSEECEDRSSRRTTRADTISLLSADEDLNNFSTSENNSNDTPEHAVQQGVVLLEDAISYRSIHHKLDVFSIKLYRWYHSIPAQWSLYAVIFLLMFLAFLETPSSLVWSTDPRKQQSRYEFPPLLLEGVEFACLLMLFLSTSIQSYLTADLNKITDFPKKHSWLTGNFIIILLSFTDIIVSLALGNEVYTLRFRRLLRPYFLASCSTMLKKTLKCIKNTLPEIASVLTLLLLHVYFFMMLGMLCFPKGGHENGNETHSELNNTEWKRFFNSSDKAFMSLLVLLTTANNPDVMMPSYSENRLYSIYFIAFSLIGTFLIFNLLTAVVYNQFRGYFQNSMQASHFRRCVAFSAAFTVLVDGEREANRSNSISTNARRTNSDAISTISMSRMKKVIPQVSMQPEQRTVVHHNLLNLGQDTDGLAKHEFDEVFANIDSSPSSEILRPATIEYSEHGCRNKVQHIILHPAFNIIGNVMVLINAIMVTIEIAIHYEAAFKEVFSRLNIVNYAFAGYYLIEQTLKVIALGKRYFLSVSDVYDGMITLALVVVEAIMLARYGGKGPDSADTFANDTGISLWDCARIINILVILRLLRIIPNFKPMAVVTTTLLDIMRNLASFAGILAIIYYVFAIIGMMLFEGKTDPPLPSNNTLGESMAQLTNPSNYECGSYEQLQYWANNFNDFASSLVVLWDIMVVNNWGVFLDAYTRRVGEWSQAYFVIWWVVSVVISVNLFIALILDHFIAKWDRAHEATHLRRLRRRETVQALFVANMHDPSPSEINDELSKHPFLRWHIQSS